MAGCRMASTAMRLVIIAANAGAFYALIGGFHSEFPLLDHFFRIAGLNSSCASLPGTAARRYHASGRGEKARPSNDSSLPAFPLLGVLSLSLFGGAESDPAFRPHGRFDQFSNRFENDLNLRIVTLVFPLQLIESMQNRLVSGE